MEIIDVAEANVSDFTHDQLARKLIREKGYSKDHMKYEFPKDEMGIPEFDKVRIVVYDKSLKKSK